MQEKTSKRGTICHPRLDSEGGNKWGLGGTISHSILYGVCLFWLVGCAGSLSWLVCTIFVWIGICESWWDWLGFLALYDSLLLLMIATDWRHSEVNFLCIVLVLIGG